MSYYAELGLKEGADKDQVLAAFRKLAFEYHPDRNPGNLKAESKFKRISEAKDKLIKGDGYGPSKHQYKSPNTPIEERTCTINLFNCWYGVGVPFEYKGRNSYTTFKAGLRDGDQFYIVDCFNVTFDVKPDENYRRVGNDLVIDWIAEKRYLKKGMIITLPMFGLKQFKVRLDADYTTHKACVIEDEGFPISFGNSNRGHLIILIYPKANNVKSTLKQIFRKLF